MAQFVERETGIRMVASSRFTRITVVCLWAKRLTRCLIMVQPRKTRNRPEMTKKCCLGRKASTQTNKTNGCKLDHLLVRRHNNRYGIIKLETSLTRRQTRRKKNMKQEPGPEGIKLLSCLTQLSTKFQLLIKTKYGQMKKFIALKRLGLQL